MGDLIWDKTRSKNDWRNTLKESATGVALPFSAEFGLFGVGMSLILFKGVIFATLFLN
jgi:hypothetical protein